MNQTLFSLWTQESTSSSIYPNNNLSLHLILTTLVLLVLCHVLVWRYLVTKKKRKQEKQKDTTTMMPSIFMGHGRRPQSLLIDEVDNTRRRRRRSKSLPRLGATRARPRIARTRSVDSIQQRKANSNHRNRDHGGISSINFHHQPPAFAFERARRSRMLVMDLLYNASLQQQHQQQQQQPPPRPGWRGHHPRAFRQGPRGPRQHHFAQEFMRLNYLVAREQALLAPAPAAAVALPSPDEELQLLLRPIAGNDPSCVSFKYDASRDSSMQQINAALKQNVTLRQIHFHPGGWKDLKTIKDLATILETHPSLAEVHLYLANSTRNFVTQIAVDALVKAFAHNPSCTHWHIHSSASTTNRTSNISETVCRSLQTAPYLQCLELHDVGVSTHLAQAIGRAQSLQRLQLVRVEEDSLELLFQHFAIGQGRLKELYIESAKEAGTETLQQFLAAPHCPLERLSLKSIQTFQRLHADRLVGALTQNTSVKHVSFQDCCFHPEVVRPLQELVKNRLDLESFQITRCNADPSMALLTVCANIYDGKMTNLQSVTMGFSLGIEDRLGGDAIRSVLRYNPNLTSLNISGSHRLGETGLRHVARGLGKNSTLRDLNLSHCSISLNSLRLLTQHLSGNPSSRLTSLNLSHNALGVQGVQVLTRDWLLQPNCVLEQLTLNRCEIYSEAFMALIRAIPQNTSLRGLEVLECGRLGVNELQELAEGLFRFGTLRVLKASCFKSPVQPIRPVPAHAVGGGGGAPDLAAEDLVFLDDDHGSDSDDDDDDDDDLELLLEDDDDVAFHHRPQRRVVPAAVAPRQQAAVAAHAPPPAHNNNINNGAAKLLKETFLAALIHNQQLEHISLTNMLECVLKPKDAMRVRAWMDFSGKRNLLQPQLQQTEIPLLEILTDVVRDCRDPRTRSLNATGLSLHYHCLRNRPDALDFVTHMLTLEAERQQENSMDVDMDVQPMDVDP